MTYGRTVVHVNKRFVGRCDSREPHLSICTDLVRWLPEKITHSGIQVMIVIVN